MQNECPNEKNNKGKKVLQASISDDESIRDDENLSEYCFMTIDVIEGDLQYVFNELYNDSLLINWKNKELKKLLNLTKWKKINLLRRMAF